MRRFLGILLCGSAFAGCASAPSSRGLDDPDAAVRIRAIKQEADRGGRADLPGLVEQLENEDPAVRLAAIEALRRLTGQVGDFTWYEEPSKQSGAIDAWRARVGLPPATSPTTRP